LTGWTSRPMSAARRWRAGACSTRRIWCITTSGRRRRRRRVRWRAGRCAFGRCAPTRPMWRDRPAPRGWESAFG
jgi:hypothetical protein